MQAQHILRHVAPVIACALLLGAIASCSYTQFSDPNAATDDIYLEDPEPAPNPDAAYLPEPVRGSFGQLSLWGYWIEVPDFGWVWKPDVDDYYWQPYFEGYWSWTSYGWTWMSYEPFGWITYHYGYWHFDPGYGWYWIPDYYWFPHGVTWIYYGDYVAWAPIPPPGRHLLDPWQMHVDDVWMVVRAKHFMSRDIRSYKYRGARTNPGRSRNVFRAAPELDYIEKKTGKKVGVEEERIPRVGNDPQRVDVTPKPTTNNRDARKQRDAKRKPDTSTKEKKKQSKDDNRSTRTSKSKSKSSKKNKGGD